MSRRSKLLGATGSLAVALCVWLGWHLVQQQSQRQPFHIAFNEWVGFGPFFLARDLGFFGELPVEFHFIAVEGDKRAGLYAGRFHMICETTDMFQTNRDSQNFPGNIVFAIDESHGGDGVVASDKVTSLRDLRGKTVVAEPGQPAHFVLQYLLSKEGMTLKDLAIQQMNSPDAAAAFIAGKADAAGTYEPYLSRALEKRPGSHLLASSKDLPGLIVDVAVVKEEALVQRRQDVHTIFGGWCKAVAYFKQHRTEAISTMAKAFKLSAREFEDTIQGLRYLDCATNRDYFGSGPSQGPLFSIFNQINKILLDNGLTSVVISADSRIDRSVVAAVSSKEARP